MQGQATYFNIFAPEKISYAINRYLNETKRLYSVLETRLTASAYLAGDAYGVADIKTFGWVRFANFTGIDLDEFPKLNAWFERIGARPAVKRGLSVPEWIDLPDNVKRT